MTHEVIQDRSIAKHSVSPGGPGMKNQCINDPRGRKAKGITTTVTRTKLGLEPYLKVKP